MLLLRILVSKEWRGLSEQRAAFFFYERVCNFYFQPVLVFI